jgi:ribosome-associated protein
MITSPFDTTPDMRPPPLPVHADRSVDVVDPTRPSKTQLKKAMHELQQLGVALTALSEDRLSALPLSETLLDAVHEFRRTKSHEGRRRQLQYIGKLMRGADVEPIREAVASAQLGPAREALALHEAEHWRDALIAGDDALTRWTDQHPASDLQQLRSLIRAARKDTDPAQAGTQAVARKGRAYRELFQFIKRHDHE